VEDEYSVRLVVVDGPETGRVFSFDGADSFLVGRSPKAHLVLDPAADRYVSRTHCLIDIRPPRIILNDLGSTNGTYVNDQRVTRSEIRDGDEIRVGRTKIRIAAPLLTTLGEAATIAAEEVSAQAAAKWLPPQGEQSWQPPGLAPPTPPSAEPITSTPPRLVCRSCAADLAHCADSDGLAGELPDALYLCRSCEQSEVEGSELLETLGGYRILGELGRGGMGVVYRAVQESTRRIVAVKQMLPNVELEEREFRLFEREIAVHSTVRHRNLARLLDHGRDRGRSYLAVEYLAGGDAAGLVRRVFTGPVPLPLAIRIGLEVLDGVDALHRSGVVHRDLKPQNILLSRTPDEGFGTAKVTDYGLAKPFEDAGNSLFDVTRDNEAAGSLMFMPPEQILNYRHVQPPADVYAIGVSLYYLLTASYTVNSRALVRPEVSTVPPGLTRNPIEAVIDDDPIPIRSRRSELPESIARVIDTAVQKELSRRYDSAARFRHELAAQAQREGLL